MRRWPQRRSRRRHEFPTLAFGGGEDTLDGGQGLDLVHLRGALGDYQLSHQLPGAGAAPVLLIQDTVAGRDGRINAMASMAPASGATSWAALTSRQQLETLGVWR
ncbi:hypothetical protein [Variovorax sp. JS1663]|uniref:hypothetical protein n=1 Tax=Variovorax sp. JS1663 TaxID=1851577 RepID=UPI000B347124|nr:hypothetical protein [Variovorax sp. JS1663]